MSAADRKPTVTVIGDSMLDRYIFCRNGGVCKEADLSRLIVEGEQLAPGAAANVAKSVNALGCQTRFVSIVGTDAQGEHLVADLERAGIDTVGVVRHGQTHEKNRLLTNGRLVSRFDVIPPAVDIPSCIDRIAESCLHSDAVLISDYGYGVITPTLLNRLNLVAGLRNLPIIVDTKFPSAYGELRATVVKASLPEVMLDFNCDDSAKKGRINEAVRFGTQILKSSKAAFVVVTLDVDGAVLLGRNAYPVHARMATPCTNSLAIGAGDVFVSILSAKLAAGCRVRESFEQAIIGTAAALSENDVTTVALTAGELQSHSPSLLVTRIVTASGTAENDAVNVAKPGPRLHYQTSSRP